jgi:hypothetical protein
MCLECKILFNVLFLHRKSNHVFTIWQHLVLLTIRQYEGKSYRMFVEWLFEAYYHTKNFISILIISSTLSFWQTISAIVTCLCSLVNMQK